MVKAPYCADGKIVDSTATTVVSTNLGRLHVLRHQPGSTSTATDGPRSCRSWCRTTRAATEQLLEVVWGTGETTTATLPNVAETMIKPPIDLDGDGQAEVVVQASGGEYSEYFVFRATKDGLTQVDSVDAGGDPSPLTSDADPAAWKLDLGVDGFRSYRLIDPTPSDQTSPVEIRTWTLEGDTLTRSKDSTEGCVQYLPTFEVGKC